MCTIYSLVFRDFSEKVECFDCRSFELHTYRVFVVVYVLEDLSGYEIAACQVPNGR